MKNKSLYESLIEQADRCRLAASRTKGTMRQIWLNKASQLEIRAQNLPVVMAGY